MYLQKRHFSSNKLETGLLGCFEDYMEIFLKDSTN